MGVSLLGEMAFLLAESNSLPAPENVIKDGSGALNDTLIDLRLFMAIKQL